MTTINQVLKIGCRLALLALLSGGVGWSQPWRSFPVAAGGRVPPGANDTAGTANFTFTVRRPTGLTVAVAPPNPCAGETVQLIATLREFTRIADVDLNLDLVHSWDEDLTIILTSPGGIAVTLFDQLPGGPPRFDDFDNTLFDDGATRPITMGTAPYAGAYRPQGPGAMAAFNNLDPLGVWTLTIIDNYYGDYGWLYKAGDAPFETRRAPLAGTELRIRMNPSSTLPLAGYPVAFFVNGVQVGIAYTNVLGEARVNYTPAAPGAYAVIASFGGDQDHEPSAGSAAFTARSPTQLTVINATGGRECKPDALLVARLTSGGAPVAGRTVNFAVEGTPVGSADTDSDGYAQLSYTPPGDWASGTRTYTASFAGDAQVCASSGSAKLFVIREPKRMTTGGAGDGTLSVCADEYGSVFADFYTGEGGDRFDPAGALTEQSLTINKAPFLFISTTHRELLSTSLQWQDQFAPDGSLTPAITQPSVTYDLNDDGEVDTLRSKFTVSGEGGILLQAELYQSVRRATAPGVSYLVQVYRLVNAGSAPLTFKWHEVWDADLFWRTGLADDWNNDEVGVGTFDGRKYVRLGEFGMPAATVALSSLTPPTYYYGGKSGHSPPGGPPFSSGTGRIWQNYGAPPNWRNYVAFLGYNIDGTCGDQTGEAQVGLEWWLTLNAGEQTMLTLVHTYGQPTPITYLPADTNGDGCVDDADLLNVLFEFGGASSGAAQTDVNGDGVVDDADLLAVLLAFGSGC